MADQTIARVVIDTEPDWLRIKSNVSQAMTDAMESRLAMVPGGKNGEAAEKLRNELKERLERLKEMMFEMVKYNIQVNGQNYEDFVQATEGFDEVLDRKMYALSTEKADYEARIAEKRKKMPEGIHLLEEDLEMRRTEAEWLPDELEDDNEIKPLEEIFKPPRYDETKETFQAVVANLSEIARVAPTQLQRAQRAQTVREEVTNMPP
ncbi:hypothetical protein L204_101857 [Cryptococcus depauperatus]|nr:hypothetical protein L204_05507 [Cryptococcus depauperatus CBS 7855]